MDAASGLTVTFTVSRLRSAGRTDAERITELTRLPQHLNEAMPRQCESVAAEFGKPCGVSDLNMRAHFQPDFNQGPQDGANASARFEIAFPGGAAGGPN